MTRHLFRGAVVVTLIMSSLGYQNRATAQDSAGASAEGKADTSQADAGASADASGDAGQSSTQSESQPATTSKDASTPSTASDAANAKNNGDKNSQSSQGSTAPPSSSPSDANTVPSPQKPIAGDKEQSVQQDGAAVNRDQADVSVQGRARLDARTQQGSHDAFKRGVQFGQATNRGLAISLVEQDSIYYRSGFRRGDVIISLYGRPVRSQDDFMRFIIMHPGQRVPVIVFRDGRRHTIYVEYPQEVVHTQRIYDNRVPQGGTAYLGVMFNAQVRDEAVVLSVNRGSPAEKAGLRQGDMILAMNGQEIRSYPEVISMIRSMRPGQEVDLVIRRGQSDTQVFAMLGAQASVRTATRPADIHVEHHSVPADQPAEVPIELDRSGNNGRLLDRDRNNDGNPDRPLLPRLRN